MSRAEAPEDAAFLDARPWRKTRCARCGHEDVPTTEVGHIEQATAGGFGIRFCRGCLLVVLTLARAEAERAGRPYEPRLPHLAEPLPFARRRAG